jgi:hypothetical protein
MQYELSNEVENVADAVIKQFHPDLSSKKIHYLILDKKDGDGMSVAKWSKGHQIAAEIKVISGDAAFLLSGESRTDDNGPASVVVLKVYRIPWTLIEKGKTREALVDSQLCRLIYDDETGKPSVLEYDAKVHNSNLKRFGAWNNELEKLIDATKELPLIEIAEGKDKVKIQKAAAGNGKAEETPKSDITSLKQDVAKKRGRTATA